MPKVKRWAVEAGRGITWDGVCVASLARVIDCYDHGPLEPHEADALVREIVRLLNKSNSNPITLGKRALK